MTIAFTLAWWVPPLIITFVSFAIALLWPTDKSDFMSGLINLYLCLPAAVVSIVAWAVAAILK